MSKPAGRPCAYCVANWSPIVPSAQECEWEHRDDPRVYGLARAIAKEIQGEEPTAAQVAWFLADANEVVDDFEPAPDLWRVRQLPAGKNDGERGIEIRLRINNVTYVALEGGKDSRGSVMKLATLREHEREATRA